MIGIYKITSPTKKIYIGQSINIEKRFKHYKSLRCKSQTKLYNSFLKYGYNNHVFEIIEECEISELNTRERYYQEIYNCIENGLNCVFVKTNDLSGLMSEESKIKMSISQTGKNII